MRVIATLHHDVGKRIARTARNVRDMPRTPAIVAMLVKDLYAIDGRNRASLVFEARANGLVEPGVETIRARLARVDALEDDVRAGEVQPVEEAIAIAIEVSDTIAAWLVREAARRA